MRCIADSFTTEQGTFIHTRVDVTVVLHTPAFKHLGSVSVKKLIPLSLKKIISSTDVLSTDINK